MQGYETICILHPDLSEEEAKAALEKFGDLIAKNGGEIKKSESWGLRKLAYKVKGQAKGTLIYYLYEGIPSTVSELERNIRIADEAIRYMTVKVDSVEEAAKIRPQLLDDPSLTTQEG